MRVTRRGLQLALAALWLLDGALQFQPFMFTTGFAHDVVSPAGDGQPVVVAGPVHLAAHVIAWHPAPANAAFATTQVLLGIALLCRRAARPALVASVVWSLGVWWFGEGLGGLLGGHAMLLTGAPGAVLLYVVLAIVAWPSDGGDGRGEPPRAIALVCWVAVWALGGLYQLLPGQNTAGAVSAAIDDGTDAMPHALVGAAHHLAVAIGHHTAYLVALVALQVLIAVAALVPGATRRASALAGSLLAVAFWVFAQSLGELATGQATDPNTGPLLVVLALAAATAVGRTDAQELPYPAGPTPAPRASQANERSPAKGDGRVRSNKVMASFAG